MAEITVPISLQNSYAITYVPLNGQLNIAASLQKSYAITYVPLNGQLNIVKSGAGAIMDPTLYQSSATKPILNIAFNNRMIVTTVAMNNTVLATRAMGNDFNREFWF